MASAKAVQLAHSIDPEYKVGSMILAVTIYPLTPNPDDIIEVMELDNEVYLFSDVQAWVPIPTTPSACLRKRACNWRSAMRTAKP